jgi:hypothetical protein
MLIWSPAFGDSTAHPDCLADPELRLYAARRALPAWFSDASLFGGFGSLFGRFNSLFGRLGNLPDGLLK